MPPRDVQARLTLLGYLFKEAMTGVSGAIKSTGAPPIQPAEKEILFAETEKAVWSFPEHWFQEEFRDEQMWAEDISNRDEVRTAMEKAITAALANRLRKAP